MLDRMVVFHKTFKFNATVLDVRETCVPGLSNFSLGVFPGNLNFSESDYVSVSGRRYVRIGESLSTTRWSYPGDIVEVAARGLLHTFDEETNLNAVRTFNPRVINKVSTVGFPTGLPAVIKRAEQDTLYYHRILDPDGNSSYYNAMIDRSPLKVFKWEQTENEVRYRVRAPGLFQKDSFRTITLKKEKPQVRAIIGKMKGKTSTSVQALRFPKSDGWTLAKAQAWADGRTFQVGNRLGEDDKGLVDTAEGSSS
jgi:hypothetical protein